MLNLAALAVPEGAGGGDAAVAAAAGSPTCRGRLASGALQELELELEQALLQINK